MKKIGLLLIAALTLFLFNCTNKSEDDATAPVMVMDQPVEGEKFAVGDEFHMEMHLSDNVALKSCTMEIAQGAAAKSTTHDDGSWHYTRTFDFSGMKESAIHEHLDVPDSVENMVIVKGAYKFTAICTDMAGNQAHHTVLFSIE